MPKPLEARLEESDLRAFLVVARSGRDPDLAPWTGGAHLGDAFVIAGPGSPPHLGFFSPMERDEAALSGLSLLTPERLDVVRWIRDAPTQAKLFADVIGYGLQLCEVPPGRIAIAGSLSAGILLGMAEHLRADGWELVPGESFSQCVRKTKSESQVEEIRRVSTTVCDAFRRVAALLAASTERDGELWLEGERLKVARLRAEIAVLLAQGGLEQAEGNLLGAGEEGAVPHNTGTDERVLRAGESLIVDLYPRARMFSDCTRTFCVGEPSEAFLRGHALVLEALEKARAAVRPGMRGWALQQIVCEHFTRGGFPTPISDPGTTSGYVHGLGHGVGFEVHEAPSFRENAEGVDGRLEVGDVFTLEPGLYDPEAGWAVRLEDLYSLTASAQTSPADDRQLEHLERLENLTPLPYDFDPRAW